MSPTAVRRALWPVVGLVLVGVLFLAVFPTRTYLSQHQERNDTQKKLAVLREENRKLSERVRLLHSDAEVERLAREQYHLVRPGEEAIAILPPASPAGTPNAPSGGRQGAGPDNPGAKGSWLARVWERVTSIP